MKRCRFLLAVAFAAAVCGCSPKSLTTATVESVKLVSASDADGHEVMYSVGEEQQALLRSEFETWKRAGFDGFGVSFVTYVPDVCLMGTTADGVGYVVDFGTDTVTVNEVYKGGDSAQYARDATMADNRFRLFLLAYIADGKLPKTDGER